MRTCCISLQNLPTLERSDVVDGVGPALRAFTGLTGTSEPRRFQAVNNAGEMHGPSECAAGLISVGGKLNWTTANGGASGYGLVSQVDPAPDAETAL
jgi:hypothetical protein